MNHLLGLILGLLALVHSSPINTVTQIPPKGEDDVLREAITDGFLIDHMHFPSVTTESPERNTTAQVTQQPSGNEEETIRTTANESVLFEGSGGSGDGFPTTVQQRDDQRTSTTTSLWPVESTASTALLRVTDDSDSESFTTQSPQSGSTSSSAPTVTEEEIIPGESTQSASPSNLTPLSPNTEPDVDSSNSTLSPDSLIHSFIHSGSGDGEIEGSTPDEPLSTTSGSTPDFIVPSQHHKGIRHAPTEANTVPPTSTAALVTHKALFEEMEGSSSGNLDKAILAQKPAVRVFNSNNMEPPLNTAKVLGESDSPPKIPGTTPGWAIIVGFIVGLAAMVMLCVAIATKDKWNGPSQASMVNTKANAMNQLREQEMQIFLQKQAPRENGQTAEYTVIPLEDLPEKDSLH